MPLKRCTLPGGGQGWKWGDSGKCYRTRAEALRQARAIFATGWTGENVVPLPVFLEAKTETQSVVFDKKKFTKAQARAWLKRNGYKSDSAEETENSYRFRQTPPGRYKSFRVFKVPGADGISFILGRVG